MEKTAAGAHKHLRAVGEPISLEECKCFCVQQSIATVEPIVVAVFAGELDAGQHNFGFFFHGRDSLRLQRSLVVVAAWNVSF